MKKLVLFLLLLTFVTVTLAFGASAAETPGTVVDAVPANFGVLADLNPEAIVEDLRAINGDHNQTPTEITGSIGITSLSGHANKNPEGVSVSVVEENGDKLIVRIPTVSLEDEERKELVYGKTIYVTFESKVMHFFDKETEQNLLV